jgi:hypothetical protein
MSYTESPTVTFKKFAATSGWQNASTEELTNDFLSISNETNLLWDSGWYEERDGKLIDPTTKETIESTVGSGTILDEPEKNVNRELEDWFGTHESGIAVWISPKKEGYYPGEKISIYRIGYKITGEKILLRAHNLFSANFKNPEEIRRFIFTEDDREEVIFAIIDWLENVSAKKIEIKTENSAERRKQAEYFAYQYKAGIPIDKIIFEMTQTRFLGENAISCGGSITTEPSSYTETFTSFFRTDEIDGWHSGVCRVCGSSTWVGPCSICKPCESKL